MTKGRETEAKKKRIPSQIYNLHDYTEVHRQILVLDKPEAGILVDGVAIWYGFINIKGEQ
jgi:hypothetical protein